MKFLFLLVLLLGLPLYLPAQSGPSIFFSDLDSGPNTGGQNNRGVWVTIWGKGFGAERGSSTVTIGGEVAAGEITPTAGQVGTVSRTAAQGGRKAVEKFLRGQLRALAEHQEKLAQYRQAGGYTSKVESTIENVRGLIRAADEWLSKN